MELYYITHTGNLIELIINKEISNKYYIETLDDILRTNNILQPRIPLTFHSNFDSQSTLSTFITISYLKFNKTLIPTLEKHGVIVMPHINNKIFVYYVQIDENTIEFFFDNNTDKQHNDFIILKTFLKYTLETINHNNFTDSEEDIFTLKTYVSKYSIIIQSKYLFEKLPSNKLNGLIHANHANSIMHFLKLNGFNTIESTLKPPQHFHNKLAPK